MRQRLMGILDSLLNIWVIGGAILLAVMLCLVTFAVLWLTRSQSPSSGAVSAILLVTPNIALTQVPPTSIELTPASEVPPTPLPGVISIGSFVQVIGTGGEGLRLRVEPGLSSRVLLLASEAEIFRVEDGPREMDGYTWWYLVGPFDPSRQGWAVTNYLLVVQAP